MEPIMIVFLGVIVGGMIVAMYLPIFDMINAVLIGERLSVRVMRKPGSTLWGPASFSDVGAARADRRG
jgi:hypothetical protein